MTHLPQTSACEDGERGRLRSRGLLSSATLMVLAALVAGCGQDEAPKDREPAQQTVVERGSPEPSSEASSVEEAPPREPPSPGAPPIRVRPASLDMGRTVRRSDARSSIELVNVGEEPLVIRGLASSCPCLSGRADGVALAAGESHEARVRYTAPFALGTQTRPLYVVVEGFEEAVRVDVSIHSVPALALDPPALDPEAQERLTITLRSLDDKPIRILRVTPEAIPDIESLRERGPAREISLQWTRAAWEAAGRPASIIFHTNREDDPRAILQTNAAAARSQETREGSGDESEGSPSGEGS